MNVFSTATAIARASFSVLREHKRLVLFPLLSLAATITIVVTFMPLSPRDPGGGIAMAALFVVINVTTKFFDAGLTSEALRALRGETTSVGKGLALALARLPAITTIGLVDSTVGLFLGRLRPTRSSKLVNWVFGTGWKLTTYLALPVLVAERRNGYASLLRSGQLFKRTWGETTIAELGLRVLATNAVLGVLLVAFVIGHLIDEPAAIVVGIVLLIGVSVTLSSVEAIYRAALYQFAAKGTVPANFDTESMHGVWRTVPEASGSSDDVDDPDAT